MPKKDRGTATQDLLKEIRSARNITGDDLNTVVGPCRSIPKLERNRMVDETMAKLRTIEDFCSSLINDYPQIKQLLGYFKTSSYQRRIKKFYNEFCEKFLDFKERSVREFSKMVKMDARHQWEKSVHDHTLLRTDNSLLTDFGLRIKGITQVQHAPVKNVLINARG